MSTDDFVNGCEDHELRLIARSDIGPLGIKAANELRRRRSAQPPKESEKKCETG